MSRRTDESPRPRVVPGAPHSRTEFPVSRVVRCRTVTKPPPYSFVATLESRRSQAVMNRVPLGEVVNLVAFAVRPREVKVGDAFGRSRRPSPSAGAIHPVEVLLVQGTRVFHYAEATHELEALRISQPRHLNAFAKDCQEILPAAMGTAIVLVGDLSRVGAVYERPESLMWRDGGALLQTLALAATAYGLAFCPLGILGTSVLDAIERAELAALGVALIGRRLGRAARAKGDVIWSRSAEDQ